MKLSNINEALYDKYNINDKKDIKTLNESVDIMEKDVVDAMSGKNCRKKIVKENYDSDCQYRWNYLLDSGISEETLQVVTDINGYSPETLDDIRYSVLGDHFSDQDSKSES